MAEASNKKSRAQNGAEYSDAPGVLDTLAQADENITRIHEDAKARKAEKAKQMRRTESDAKARREEVREKRAAQQKQSDMIAEQKLAAFRYAENYRKKLVKDKEKMQSVNKQRDIAVRAEAEAAVRVEREAELERIREREYAEAKARSERASALLNRVTKCAVRDENGNVRMVDRSELAKIEAERARVLAEEQAAQAQKLEEESLAQEAEQTTEPELEPAVVTEATLTADSEEVASAIMASLQKNSPLFKEYENKAREEIAARRVEEFFLGEMMDTRDGKFVLNIIEDDFTVSITDKDDDSIAAPVTEDIPEEEAVDDSTETEEEAPAEEPTEEEETESEEKDEKAEDEYPPVELKNPIIFELRRIGAEAVTFFDLVRYLSKVRKYTKAIHSGLDSLSEMNKAEGPQALAVSIMDEIISHVDLLNIRCDALINCVRLADAEPNKLLLKLIKKRADKQAQQLYVEIDSYNKSVMLFRRVTGEELTLVSPFLPERILAKTGAPVIPAYECRQKFIEGFQNQHSKPNSPYTLVFPSFKEMATGKPIMATSIDAKKHTTIKRVIEDVLFSAMTKAPEVYNDIIVDNRSYKKNLKLAKKVISAINGRIEVAEITIERTGGSQMLAIELMNLQKEKALIAFHRLANSLKTTKVKYTVKAKSYVIEVIKEYNSFAKKYAKMAEIDLMKYGMPLADYILNTGTVPETPVFMTRTDIFETLGDNTRLVGERVDEDLSEYQLVFGDISAVPQSEEPPKRQLPSLDDKPQEQPADSPAKDKGKGKKKYMAADDYDTVYLTIPFDDKNAKTGKKPRMNANKKSAGQHTSDAPIDILTSVNGDAVDLSGTRISISREREPVPVRVERGSANAAYSEPEEQPTQGVEITKETIDTLARALSDAVKIAEYAKTAEKYAEVAERAAKIIEEHDKVESQYAIEGIPQPVVQEFASKGDVDAVRAMTKGQIRGFLQNSESKLKNARRAYDKAEALKSAARPDAKPRLTIECISAAKVLIDCLSSILAAYSNVMDTQGIEKIRRELYLEINNYNELVEEYEKIAGGKLTVASLSMVEDIISGRPYQTLPTVKFTGKDGYLRDRRKGSLALLETGVPAPSKDVRIMNREQLHAYLSRQERVISKYKHQLSAAERKISSSKGQERAAAIVDAIAAERKIINELCEHLLAACQVSSYSDTSKIKRAIDIDIKNHNALVAELEKSSGEYLTPASKDMAQEIISGLDYQPLPEVSYTVLNPIVTTVDKINEAIEKGKELYNNEITKEGHLNLTTVAAKVAAQANKDVAVLTHCAAFEVSLLESERDILRYGHGGEMRKFSGRRRRIAKLIKSIKKNNKKAIKCEEEDNKRYYQIVTTNPATMETKTARPNRKKMAALRKRMIELLNERDKINGKLTAIYTGEEYNLDGTGVNQTWRRVKADAVEKAVKRDKSLAREVKYLPTSESEKARIYELMNRRLNAISTVALCKYRMKKEYLHDSEWNKLVKDKKASEKLTKKLTTEIKVTIKKVYQRNKERQKLGIWLTGVGIFLLFIAMCAGIYIAFFHSSLSSIFSNLLGLLNK